MTDNNIYKTGIENVKYSVISQGIYSLLSIVTVFILPRAMGITQFGYWQVYLFYVGYVVLFCFGFGDGLYLRYGNYDYNQLPFEKIRSAMRIFSVVITIITLILFALSFFEKDPYKVFAFCTTSLNLIILGISNTLLVVLQFTNRIKLYSILVIANKALFVACIIVMMLMKRVDFRLIIAVDIATKLLLLGINIYKLKELFVGKALTFSVGIREYADSVIVGIKLVIAYIISSLILGMGRFIVERFMPINTYSVYSFATTITAFILLFIAAFSLSLYPLLRRVSKDKLPTYYVNLNKLICTLLFILLVGYYPLYYLIKFQFSSFKGVFEYFYLLFIITVVQSKMQFLINTYYKTLREERAMLVASLAAVAGALIVIIPAFYYTRSILVIVIGTTAILILQCYISEIYLKKKMAINNYWNIAAELLLMGVFILGVLLENKLLGFLIYAAFVTGYMVLNRKILFTYTKLIINQLRIKA
jgi:O-antigen/teichoic acid export membrane protein